MKLFLTTLWKIEKLLFPMIAYRRRRIDALINSPGLMRLCSGERVAVRVWMLESLFGVEIRDYEVSES